MKLQIALIAVVCAVSASAADRFVSPTGTPTGDGSQARPWDLKTALKHPATLALAPGDTIFLRGGVYRGSFDVNTRGTKAAPIIVRSAPGEWAVLDGSGGGYDKPVLYVGRDGTPVPTYTYFLDFQLTNSNSNRADSTLTTSCPATHCHGIYVRNGRGMKFINLVINDNGLGIGMESASTDWETYGNLVYYNGWEGPDRAHGHGWYGKNKCPDIGIMQDNIIHMNFDNGIQARTGDANGPVDCFLIDGNIVFENASFSTKARDKNFIIGHALDSHFSTISNNYFYYLPVAERGETKFGYSGNARDGGLVDSRVFDNYVAGGRIGFDVVPERTPVHGNFFYSNEFTYPGGQALLKSTYPDNQYVQFSRAVPMKGIKVFVRPNRWQKGRGHIAVYNWDLAANVDVDLSTVLTPGQKYEIKDALNYFGAPVASGTYGGSPVRIPMTGLTIAKVFGTSGIRSQPVHTAPQFGAFVVVPEGSGSLPTPTPTAAPPPSITPNGGAFTLPATVTLSASGLGIHYTLDGSDPSAASPKYTSPLVLPSSATVKARTIHEGYLDSAIVSAVFTITAYAPPTNPLYHYVEAEAGTITGLAVLDDPAASGGQFLTNTIRDKGEVSYAFTAADAGTYAVWLRAYLPDGNQDSVFVKMDGAEDIYDVAEELYFEEWRWGRVNGRAGGAPLAVNPRIFQLAAGAHTLTIRGRETGARLDRVLVTNDLAFVPGIETPPPPPPPPPPGDRAIAPTISPLTSAIVVTLASGTAGATIHYTTDGSTPTEASSVYAGPLVVNSTVTLKAIARRDGLLVSDVTVSTFTFVR